MCLCDLCTDRFLGSVAGTDELRIYCRARGLLDRGGAFARDRAAALATLPAPVREQIGTEMAAVRELGRPDGVAHLLAAAGAHAVPPEDVPDGPPLALWFLLRRPDLFWDVYFHHAPPEADTHHVGRGPPGIAVPDLPARAGRLAQAVGAAFLARLGAGRRAWARAYRLPEGLYVAVRVEGRRRRNDTADGLGRPGMSADRAAVAITFAYHPRDGTVLLRAPACPPEAVRDFFDCFGRTVLGAPVRAGPDGFVLDHLRSPFRPLPDAPDMELVRVAALQLRLPARDARRGLRLDTLPGDTPDAVGALVAAHAAAVPADARVTHAVLQVRLRIGGRGKDYLVRLWPDRCDVGPGAVGDRLLACLRRWGL